jgi:antitoxin MazE
MKSRIQKWGNSLAIRIPKAFADQLGFEDNAVVDLVLENGVLTLAPLPTTPFSLDTLLEGITDENLHNAIDTGVALGNEVW